MNFTQNLKKYAQLLVSHGLNVQKGQVVQVNGEILHRDLAELVAEAAYDRGAKFVAVELSDPRIAKVRLDKSTEEDLSYLPPYSEQRYSYLVDAGGANLSLVGPEEPELLEDADPVRVNLVRKARYLAAKRLYDEGIGHSRIHWCVAAAATPKWGQRVFPHLREHEAEKALWEQIFRICRVDQEDPLACWRDHNTKLQSKAKSLTDLQIKSLHFKGPGTDLRVGLSPRAVFKGGSEMSSMGVEFEPNVPTEECFTTPDYRLTEGYVRATRPFLINGKLIRDLEVSFESGRIKEFKASAGAETFEEYINSDEGAARLGEVALVSVDTPIFQSGLVFEEILFDENAACHIAVGSAYKHCLRDFDKLTPEGFEEIGCNESSVHTDMMISSEEVDVDAETYEGKKIPIIRQGVWA